MVSGVMDTARQAMDQLSRTPQAQTGQTGETPQTSERPTPQQQL
jgi:hypothetical protein